MRGALYNRNRTTIDHVLRSSDGACTRRDQKLDEVRDLAGRVRSAQWNSAERIHDDPPGAFRIDMVLPGNLRDETHGASVSTQPGETRTTRTPWGLTSLESALL